MNKWQLSIVILVLCWLASFFLPWLAIVIICFVCGLLWQGGSNFAFWGAFSPIYIMILIQLLFISFADKFRTAHNIGVILGELPTWAILIIVPLLYALVCGLACMSGSMLRRSFLR